MANNSSFTLSIKALFDASDVKSKINDIQNAFNKLNLSDKLKGNLEKSFTSLEKALTDFETRSAKGVKTNADAKGLTGSLDKVVSEFTKLQDVVNKVKQEIGEGADIGNLIKLNEADTQALKNLQQDAKKLKEELASINASSLKQLQDILTKIKGEKTTANTKSIIDQFVSGDIQGALSNLDKLIEKQKKLQDNPVVDRTGSITSNIQELENLRKAMVDASSAAQDKVDALAQNSQQQANIVQNAYNNAKQGINDAGAALQNYGNQASNASGAVSNLASNQARLNTELSQVKSRIQYFLGITNAVNLFKRGVRSAFETVKQLDAAMTETAVVTNKTVKDMWNQLPEYTKRANALGVTTLDAYKAATLYYQQGLNDQQAAELSNETLKMARIAGLEAAEATDRMTNALRGFNMELNAVNAQKVDDVYSKLAAMSASNVDEISTAMTKVASLAHNANMDFETTSAFLAQIIETTRESAETAGTALKTVVARFSEVKKLVNTEQLQGKDEEGQVIDVNKVSAALRTAGVDLNKYFIGEVGLDDIFMELASKWDNLTSVQQRYIATQAAGSRQQSRFIAMMQDYARTQELVSAAYNAEGASAKQFEKTQDSLQSKLAKLKNAWNEFLMGITNSGVIKFVVSTLTLLLNIVNKLTGAFGESASGFLKFSIALGTLVGLKKLFSDGGLLSKGLEIFGDTKLGKFFGLGNKALETSAIKAGTTLEASATTAGTTLETAGTAVSTTLETGSTVVKTTLETSAATAGNTLIEAAAEAGQMLKGGASQNTLTQTGQKAIQGTSQGAGITVGALGARKIASSGQLLIGGGGRQLLLSGGSGAAGAGLSSAAIGGIAAAVAAVLAAAVAVQSYVASGEAQVKKAEQATKKQQKILDKTQENNKLQREAYDEYVKNQKILTSSTNKEERASAQDAMSQALIQLASVDANNIKTDSSGNVTINQTYIQEQKAENEKQEKIESGKALISEGYENQSKAEKAEKSRIYINKYTGKYDTEGGSLWDFMRLNGLWFTTTLPEEIQEGMTPSGFIPKNVRDIYNAKKTAEANKYRTNTEKQISAGAADILSTSIDDTEIINSVASAYGKVLSGLSADDIEKRTDDTDQVQKELKDLAAAAQDDNIKLLLDVIGGSYEGAINSEDFTKIYNNANEEAKNAIKTLLFGKNAKNKKNEDVIKAIEQYSDDLDKQQAQLRLDVANKLMKAGMKNNKFLSKIGKDLTVSQLKQLDSFVDQWANYGEKFNRSLLTKIATNMDAGTWDNSDFKKFVSNITDNPILTLQALQKEAKKTKSEFKNLASALIRFESGPTGQFSKTNLLQSFGASDDYNQLSEKISSLVKENGRINSDNIKELSKESKELAALLDTGAISANGLANALTALNVGKITVFDLNEEVIELYENFDLTAGIIERAGSLIKNFDPGEDYADAFTFIDNAIEKMNTLLKEVKVGSPQLRKYLDLFFNNPPGKRDIKGQKDRVKQLEYYTKDAGINFWTKVGGFDIDPKTGEANAHIEEFANSEFTTYKEYLKARAADQGLDFSDEFYDIMLRGLAEYDTGGIEEIASTELDHMMAAFGEGATPSKQQIQAIADAYGLQPEDVFNAWKNKWDKTELDYNDLEDRKRSYTTDIKDLTDAAIQHAKDRGAYNSGIKSLLGGNKSAILTELGIDPKTGTFSIDYLKAKIKKIVPEVADGSMTLEEWFQDQVNKNDGKPIKLPAQIVTAKKVEGDWVTETVDVEIEASSFEEYEAKLKALQDAMQQNSLFDGADEYIENLGSTLASTLSETEMSGVTASLAAAQKTANAINKTLSATTKKNIHIEPDAKEITIGTGSTKITLTIQVAANGGLVAGSIQTLPVVASAAKGTLRPGMTLTGEEAPEIVWNKDKGYAYITGKHGPEFQNLKPGDRVFDGQQTKQILNRSKNNLPNTFKSMSGGNGNDNDFIFPVPGGGGDGGYNGQPTNKKTPDWKKGLDWLYNLIEDIAELERRQTRLSEEHERYLKDAAKTGKDLYDITRSQLKNLYTQLDNYEEKYSRRLFELSEKLSNSNLYGYVWWNEQDQTIEIDWDAINQINDEKKYKEITDLISEIEKIQDELDSADQAIWEIKGQIAELQNRYLKEFVDFQKRVYDAVVKSYRDQIDSLSELDKTLNDTNGKILDSIKDEIDLQRKIRDNTDTEKNIQDLEQQLAYLRRDTANANEVDIKNIEKELKENRKDYTDDLIDQALDKLEKSNSDASEQRQKQIDLLTAQLEYWEETGALWDEINQLIKEGVNSEGTLIRGSNLEKILQNADSWKGMSEEQRQVWANELIIAVNQVGAYLLKIADTAEIISEGVWAYSSDEHAPLPSHSIPSASGEGYSSDNAPERPDEDFIERTFALSNIQTEAFMKLSDIQPFVIDNTSTPINNYNGNTYIELTMNVNEIANDYDVDRLIERVKENIYDVSSYRNVNNISFTR